MSSIPLSFRKVGAAEYRAAVVWVEQAGDLRARPGRRRACISARARGPPEASGFGRIVPSCDYITVGAHPIGDGNLARVHAGTPISSGLFRTFGPIGGDSFPNWPVQRPCQIAGKPLVSAHRGVAQPGSASALGAPEYS